MHRLYPAWIALLARRLSLVRCMLFMSLCLIMFSGCTSLSTNPEGTDVTATLTPVGTNPDVAMYRANLQRTGSYTTTGVPQLHGLLWSYEVPGSVIKTPLVVAHNSIYLLTSKGGDGSLHILDASTGAEQWQIAAYLAPPTVVDSIMYYANSGSLYAMDTRTKKELWNFHSDKHIELSPAIANRLVYIGTYGGSLYALNKDTGQQHWQFHGGDKIVSEPAIDDGTIYFTAESVISQPGQDVQAAVYRLYALDSETGQVRWALDNCQSPSVADGRVYCVVNADAPESEYLVALDSRSGHEEWRYKLDDYASDFTFTMMNKIIYIGMGQRSLVAVNAQNGQEAWRFAAGGRISVPATDGDAVYFGADDKQLYSVDAKTGQLRWKFPTKTVGGYPPVVGDGVVYFADEENVYAVH